MENKKYDSKFLKVYENEGWTYASRKDTTVAYGNHRPDAVIICAWYEGKLVVVRQFRKSINDYIYELPAGLLDGNEGVLECAKRELKEETGLDMMPVKTGWYVGLALPSVGITDEIHALVVCGCDGEISTEGNEGDERIEVELWTQKDCEAHIDAGHMVDERIAMLYLFPAILATQSITQYGAV